MNHKQAGQGLSPGNATTTNAASIGRPRAQPIPIATTDSPIAINRDDPAGWGSTMKAPVPLISKPSGSARLGVTVLQRKRQRPQHVLQRFRPRGQCPELENCLSFDIERRHAPDNRAHRASDEAGEQHRVHA